MPIFIFFVLFIVWLTYEMRKNSTIRQKHSDDFWERERTADNTRRKDISNLDYITIPIQQLPFDDNATGRILTCQNTIRELQDAAILNLTGTSNTDLKLEYGAANLPVLIDADANFTKLVSNLARWGQELYEQGNLEAARAVLEYGISIHTDVSSNYITLGKMYLAENQTDAIYDLIEQAYDCKSIMKDSIIKQLRQLLEQEPS